MARQQTETKKNRKKTREEELLHKVLEENENIFMPPLQIHFQVAPDNQQLYEQYSESLHNMIVDKGLEIVILTNKIISMANSLGLKVVAEGVETKNQLRFMCAHGCPYIQGYLFSPPLPAEEIIGFLEKPTKELFRELY